MADTDEVERFILQLYGHRSARWHSIQTGVNESMLRLKADKLHELTTQDLRVIDTWCTDADEMISYSTKED